MVEVSKFKMFNNCSNRNRLPKRVNKISNCEAALINDGFNPAIARRFGYSFEKIGSGSLLQKALK